MIFMIFKVHLRLEGDCNISTKNNDKVTLLVLEDTDVEINEFQEVISLVLRINLLLMWSKPRSTHILSRHLDH